MVGMYPNCYYPQYRNLSIQTIQSWQNTLVSGYTTTKQTGKMPAQLLSSSQAAMQGVVSHFLNTQSGDGFRKQWVGPSIWNAPSADLANTVADTASQIGVDPDYANNVYYSTSPNLAAFSQYGYPSLNAQINQTPSIAGSLDNANFMLSGNLSAVYLSPVGTFCTSLGGSTQMGLGAGFLMGVGALLLDAAPLLGPAAPFVAAAGAILIAGGAIEAIVAFVCAMDGY
jgi:hypothetical protein